MTRRRWAVLGAVYVALQVVALFVLPWLTAVTASLVAQLASRLAS